MHTANAWLYWQGATSNTAHQPSDPVCSLGPMLVVMPDSGFWNCWQWWVNSIPTLSSIQVSKDDRSDIESSSDEEDALTNGTKLHHHSPFKGTTNANGTNGHLTTGTWVGDHYMASSRTMCNVGEVQKGQPWWKTSQHWTFLFLKDRYIKNSMLLHGIWAHLSAR